MRFVVVESRVYHYPRMGRKWLRGSLIVLEGIAGVAMFVFAGFLRFYVYPQQLNLGFALLSPFAISGPLVTTHAMWRWNKLKSESDT